MNKFLDRLLSEKDKPETAETQEQAPTQSGQSAPFFGNARIAVYDSLSSPPQVFEVSGKERQDFIDSLGSKIYHLSHERGGGAPFTAIKELVENLIHADFKEVVVTILDKGNTIRLSDQGPGIKDKTKVFEPGFSTASCDMKSIIKGVGSGLPIAKEILAAVNGVIKIEDNLSLGTVVTLELAGNRPLGEAVNYKKEGAAPSGIILSNRQKKVLSLVAEIGPAGPSDISSELKMSLSTAYRDLKSLEDLELVAADERGRRVLTGRGMDFIESFLNLTG